MLDEVSEPLEVEAKVLELQGMSANATADDGSGFFGGSFFGSASDTTCGSGGDRTTMTPGARAAAAGGDDGAGDSVFDFSVRHVASDMVMQILEPLFEMLIIDDQAGDERNNDGDGSDGGSAARDAAVARPAAPTAASTEGYAAARGGGDTSSSGFGGDGAPSRALQPATKPKRASPFQFTERGLELVRPITLRQRTLVALAGGKFGFGNVRLGRCVIDGIWERALAISSTRWRACCPAAVAIPLH